VGEGGGGERREGEGRERGLRVDEGGVRGGERAGREGGEVGGDCRGGGKEGGGGGRLVGR